MKLLWLEIAIGAISSLIGLLDVREYYANGRMAFFLVSLFGVIVDVWLVMAISRRKSWARKTYLVLTILGLTSTVLTVCFSNYTFLVSDNFLICLADFASDAISAYCVYLFFVPDIKAEFLPDSEKTGAEATINRYQCIAYISTILVGSVIFLVMDSVHQDSEQIVDDMVAAAAKGSKEAKDSFIDILHDVYVSELPACDRDNPEAILNQYERAVRDVESVIHESQTEKANRNAHDDSIRRLALGARGIARGITHHADDIGRFFKKIALGVCVLVGVIFKKTTAMVQTFFGGHSEKNPK